MFIQVSYKSVNILKLLDGGAQGKTLNMAKTERVCQYIDNQASENWTGDKYRNIFYVKYTSDNAMQHHYSEVKQPLSY
jgi:hypothetical protein